MRDNIKGFMIIFVVIGHLALFLLGNSVFKSIYLFVRFISDTQHMNALLLARNKILGKEECDISFKNIIQSKYE